MSIEQELLRMLESRKPAWPFDEATDTAYVRKLYALYGAEINLVEKFFLWESYYGGKPARERTNPRLAFHKWCIRGVELKKKYAAGANKNDETPKRAIQGSNRMPERDMASIPRRREAGNAASAPGINNVNVLAAGIIAAKCHAGLDPAPRNSIETFALGGGRAAMCDRNVAPTQLTQEELEARRKKILDDHYKQKEQGHEG